MTEPTIEYMQPPSGYIAYARSAISSALRGAYFQPWSASEEAPNPLPLAAGVTGSAETGATKPFVHPEAKIPPEINPSEESATRRVNLFSIASPVKQRVP